MKTCTLIITSKTRLSLKKFVRFFNKKNFKNFSCVKKVFRKKKRKKTITILKSPHVYKTAQEQFEIRYYSLQFTINIIKIFKILLFIKKLKTFVFSDINIKVKLFYNKKKQEFLNKRIFNIDNFKTKSLRKNNFEDQIVRLKMFKLLKIWSTANINYINSLNSSNLLQLFDLSGNKIIKS